MPQTAAQRREPAPFGITPRMATLLSDPCRARILDALDRQPTSASQFVRQFGGELSGIARQFRQLARWGYAEVCDERSGRRGGASVERVYRLQSVPDLDLSTWDTLVATDRAPAKRPILEPYVKRLVGAVNAGVPGRHSDTHLTWDSVTLDRLAWKWLGEQLEQVHVGLRPLRVAPPYGPPNRPGLHSVEVGLCLFRSAEPPFSRPRREKHLPVQAKAGAGPFIDSRFASAASNEWRSRILERLLYRALSPSQFVAEQGGDPSYIARCFRELMALGFVEVVEERRGGRRRGGIERVCKTSTRVYFDDSAWSALPLALRTEVSTSILGSFLTELNDAVSTGCIDETAGHLSWSRLRIGPRAWLELRSRLEELFQCLPKLEAEALVRSGNRPERLIRAVVGITSFRVPGHS